VAAFAGDMTYLMPTDTIEGIGPGARVIPVGKSQGTGVGDELLGRVIGGKGEALDHKGPVVTAHEYPLWNSAVNPLSRVPIESHLMWVSVPLMLC